MGKVINNVVKMDWDESRWLQTKGAKPVFVLACKEYENSRGEIIPVFFNPFSAWIHADDEGLFTFKDIKDFLSEGLLYDFPENYSEYIPIATLQGDIDRDVLETYGLSEYATDIVNRLADVMPYGEEEDLA